MKKTCAILFSIFILLGILPAFSYAAAVDSGKCGELTWTLDDKGALTISGTGAMEDFEQDMEETDTDFIQFTCAPWGGTVKKVKRIKTIVVEDGVTCIGSFAFAGCSRLTSVTISDSVKSLGWGAFSGCNELSILSIPKSVTSIEGFAFVNCSKLTSISIPETCKNLNLTGLFNGCEMLKSVKLPSRIEVEEDEENNVEINSSFAGCVNLNRVTLPEGITYFGDYVFAGCEKLDHVDLPESLMGLGYMTFAGCVKLKEIHIPDSVGFMSDAFQGCVSLKEIELPESLKYLGEFSFAGCKNLTTVYMYSSVEFIGGSPFYGCKKLMDIYYNGTRKQWQELLNNCPEFPSEGEEDSFDLSKVNIHFLDILTESGKRAFVLNGQKASDLLQNNNVVDVLDKNGHTLAADALIGSGMTIVKANGEKKTVIVKGDNNGDGIVGADDARLALRRSVSLEKFTDWQEIASKVANATEVTASEARLILRGSVGLEKITEWFMKVT